MTRSSRFRRIARPLLTLAAALASIVAIMVFFEERLIYFPTRYPDGLWETEQFTFGSDLSIEDSFFTSEDGVRLHGWWCVPQDAGLPTAELVLLWFHGNAGNLSYRADMLLRLAKLPVRVLLVDYRGYGRSAGKPSERGLYLDADAAWRHLTQDRGVPPDRIVIFGKSLGGAVAVHLASRVEPAGLIVQSTFTSARDMARQHFPFLPTFLLRTRMDSLSLIGSVRCPKLFIHSPADEVVPFRLGRRLFDAAPPPKRFVEIPGSPHNETYLVGGNEYLDALARFLHSCLPTKR